MKILLLLSKDMSLKAWAKSGQLSRELSIYNQLAGSDGHIYIHSYGKNESKYVIDYPNISVMDKPAFFPDAMVIPRKIVRFLINPIYRIYELIFRSGIFMSMNVVKTNQFSDVHFAWQINKLFKAKMIIRMGYYHTLDEGRFHSKREYVNRIKKEKKYFQACDLIMVTNHRAKEFIVKKYNIPDDKIVYQQNYIDTDLFSPVETEKDIDILCVGRLVPEKRLDILLQNVNNMHITLIGTGPEYEKLQNIASERKLNLNILPFIENHQLPLFYNRSKIFVLPSKYEGNPKALLEALSCGSLCVGSNVSGINNVIEHGKNGYLFDDFDESFDLLISELLKGDFTEVRKSARNYIMRNNSLINTLGNEKQILKQLSYKS